MRRTRMGDVGDCFSMLYEKVGVEACSSVVFTVVSCRYLQSSKSTALRSDELGLARVAAFVPNVRA